MGKLSLNKFDFNIANAGWSGAIAGALSAFLALAPVNDAQAQGYERHPPGAAANPNAPPSVQGYTLSPTDSNRAVAGAKAAGEEDLITPYFQFVDVMQNKDNGSCCHMKDGVANIEVEETDDPAFPYQMLLTHTSSGLRLESPLWVKIPAAKVLTSEHAISRCEPFVEAAEANGIDHTCTPPPFSVGWISDGTSLQESTGMHRLGNEYVSPDYVVPADKYKSANQIAVYCFWPEPSQF